mgnify:CR=1 FL=1
MKIIGVVILLTVLLVIGVVALLSWSEEHSNKFLTYQEAQESGIITRGWIPSFIPPSSYNIKEHHRVDTPVIFVEINFKPEDISYFERACDLLNKNIYKCNNTGYPVKVIISNNNHAIIKSI